jgi:hypothetical protein
LLRKLPAELGQINTPSALTRNELDPGFISIVKLVALAVYK